jgi:uncharacterized membrane protein YqjE
MEELKNNDAIPVGDWMLTLFLTAIPIVGIILLFVWAFGSNTQPSKANWAKAALIWLAIIIVLNILGFVIFGSLLMSLFS